ncbi:unnamed protein product [Ectocarpus sp. CCAP 1310/34]|nr:unnamed protein product [Ectocarpus sp. CCAP 1310/34]
MRESEPVVELGPTPNGPPAKAGCKTQGDLTDELFSYTRQKHSAFIPKKNKVAVRKEYSAPEIFGVSDTTLQNKARHSCCSARPH